MPTAGGDAHLPKVSEADLPLGRAAEASAQQGHLSSQPSNENNSTESSAGGIAPEPVPTDSLRSRGSAPEAASPVSGEIWLDGDVLACACPGCGAPMSIRLWLGVADCWRCGTSIELTEEQQQAAWRLLRQQAAASQGTSPDRPQQASSSSAASGSRFKKSSFVSSPAGAKPGAEPPKEPPGVKKTVRAEAPWIGSPPPVPSRKSPPEEQKPMEMPQAPPSPGGGAGFGERESLPGTKRRRISAAERAFRQRLRQAQQGRPWHLRIQDWLKNLPAWLVSLLLHMALLLLLGLWIPEEAKEKGIILSSSVGPYDLETELGYQPEIEVPRPEFDQGGELLMTPLSVQDILGDPSLEWEPLDPGLHRTPSSDKPPHPGVNASAPALQPGSLLRGRDPTIRNQILYSQGGTSATEAAVARALRWISRHQNPDGSFSLHAFNRTSECQGQCNGTGAESDVAGTALALLPMLGAGQTHQQGEYASVVRSALDWLLARQKSTGDLRDPAGRMYAHGLASIVLCEAFALTGDSQLREAAQRALDFIIQAQHPAGGWRYEPGQPGDTSMVGWQLMALNSGRMANLNVPTETLLKAGQFLHSVQADSAGGQYGYLPGTPASPAMTAEALLCRQYLGWPQNHAGLRAGVRFLLDRHPPTSKELNIYYWYYATQVLHHYGGADWDRWNQQMRRLLVESQVKKGHAAGSWNPDPLWGSAGGRLFQTSLAACTLEVYYRYLPLYRAKAVAQSLDGKESSPTTPALAPSSFRSPSSVNSSSTQKPE